MRFVVMEVIVLSHGIPDNIKFWNVLCEVCALKRNKNGWAYFALNLEFPHLRIFYLQVNEDFAKKF